MALTLFVPDLLPPPDAPGEWRSLRLPALERWLARADATRHDGAGLPWLLAQWGLAGCAPVAALSRRGEADGREDGPWLRADPIHQRIDRHALVVHPPAALGLSRDETDEAIAALNAFFGRDGLAFEAPHPERWYVRLPAGEAPSTTPLAAVAGRNPFGHLPEGGNRLHWRSIFSEAQMLLSGLPLNAAREAAGRPALNALWFWGEGDMPAGLSAPFAAVYAREPTARGLALAGGIAPRPPLSGLAQVPPAPEPALVVLDDLGASRERLDAAAWREAALGLEAAWFAHLPAALARHGRVRLVLPTEESTTVFELAPAMRWRFLRRARPLASHA